MYLKQIPQEVKGIIDSARKFIIVAHKNPDADTLCSAIALGSFIKRRGKEVSLHTAGPFTRIETLHLQEHFNTNPLTETEKENAAVIIVDCNSPDRIGFIEDEIKGLPVIIIDHHATDADYGDYRWVEPTYPATTLMIQELIYVFGDKPTTFEAEILFLGFCTDTGFFRHLDKGSNEWIKRASSMVEHGASPKDTYKIMTGGKTLGSRRLMGRILERCESHYDGQVLISWEKVSDRKELDTDDRDSDTLYQSLLSISGVEAIAVIREESTEKCVVGLRSIQDVNVRALAETFDGGGHQRASGFSTEGTVEAVKQELIKRFANYL